MPSMMRITLNVILRAMFGADGARVGTAAGNAPGAIKLGSTLVLGARAAMGLGPVESMGPVLPESPRIRRDRRPPDRQGACRPRPRRPRRRAGVDVAERPRGRFTHDARRDRRRTDHHARRRPRDDGHHAGLGRGAARRHPELLERLVADLDGGSEDLLHATILEVLRTRPVIDVTFRQVKAPTMEIGPWTLPQGQTIVASIGLLHADEAVFPDARRFDPDRFLARPPDPAEWIPYGGRGSSLHRGRLCDHGDAGGPANPAARLRHQPVECSR